MVPLYTQGNLEASVRSRGAGVGRRRDRDLIEAGLSEPAGWRARLWGSYRGRLVREPPSAEAGDDLGRLIAIGGGDCGRRNRTGEVVLPVIAADPATCRIEALTANGMVPAGAIGVRWRKSRAAGWQAHHEVSSQKDVRQGAGRARTASMTMAPPQDGQRSGRCDGTASWTCSAGGPCDGASSSRRQSASLAARSRFARKP